MVRASASSGLNNIKEFNFLQNHKFVDHYGFSRDEVKKLFNDFSIDENLFLEATHWYDGYQIKNQPDKKIFNPWSLVNYMFDLEFNNNWQQSGSIKNLLYIFKINGIREKIQDLIEGNQIKFTTKKDFSVENFQSLQQILNFKGERLNEPLIDLFFTFILERGYLSYDANDSFKAPNNEIKMEFAENLIDYYVDTYKLTTDNFKTAIDALNKGLEDENNNFKDLESALTQLFKPLVITLISDPNNEGIHPNEDIFHSLIIAIAVEANFHKLGSEIWYQKKARADCVISNKKKSFAIIIEIKFSKKESKSSKLAIAAVEQANKYIPIFEKYKSIKTFKLVGITISENRSVTIETKLEKK